MAIIIGRIVPKIDEGEMQMPRSLDLSLFEPLLEQGHNFEVTEEQYVNHVKKTMPQTNYLKKSSPVAKLAREHGYKIQVEERIHRVLIFIREEES